MIELAYGLYVLDMDGTIYLGDGAIPGALQFLHRVVEAGADYLFLTNNSSKTAEQYVQKLGRIGWPTSSRHVLTSADATRDLLLKETSHRRLFLLAPPAVAQEFESTGFELNREEPDALVLAYDTTLEFATLTRFCHKVREGLPFFATHPDINCPSPEGPVPDVGAMLKLIEASTGRLPDRVIGKPSPDVLRAAMGRFGASPRHTIMIGDRLYTDVLCGIRAGTSSALVLSGESTRATLEASLDKPTYVLDSVADIAPRSPSDRV